MSIKRPVDELAGKTIESAFVVPRSNGDAEFVIRFTDGATATVSAWQRAGHSLEMNVDLSPNDHPLSGGSMTRRGM